MRDEDLGQLAQADLVPPRWQSPIRGWAWDEGIDYVGRYRGSMLASAIGDALGRPVEGLSTAAVRARFPDGVTEFRKWRGWRSGPTGTITDDTQLSMVVADSLIARGDIDPEDLALRLIDWLPVGRGKGAATTAAVERLTTGVPWHEAGDASDGNGAAMRAAPVGLAYAVEPDRLRRAAALSAVVTHTGPMAVAGTVAQALAVAWTVHQRPGALDPETFCEVVAGAVDDLFEPGAFERRPGTRNRRVRLVDRIRELPGLLRLEPDQAFDRLYNGAFILESLPSAFWCFLRSPLDAERVLVTAASGGHDADTVAAMAGALVGAYVGETALPSRWLGDVEFAERLGVQAEALAVLAGVPSTSR